MDINETRRSNINRLAEKYGRPKLAEMIGYKDTVYINQLCGGHGSFGTRTARKIEQQLKLPHGWMDQTQQAMQVSEPANTYRVEIKGFVPLISWVQAGQWEEAIDLYQPGDSESVHPTTVNHSRSTFALRVDGDSMTAPPGAKHSFPHGMIIYVDPEQRGGVNTGDYVIAKHNGHGQVTFKQLGSEEGRPVLKPLNTNGQYPIIRDEFEIIGKVIDASWGAL